MGPAGGVHGAEVANVRALRQQGGALLSCCPCRGGLPVQPAPCHSFSEGAAGRWAQCALKAYLYIAAACCWSAAKSCCCCGWCRSSPTCRRWWKKAITSSYHSLGRLLLWSPAKLWGQVRGAVRAGGGSYGDRAAACIGACIGCLNVWQLFLHKQHACSSG